MTRSAHEPTGLGALMGRRGFLKRASHAGLAAAMFPYILRDWTDSAQAAVEIQDLDVSVNSPPVTPPSSTSGGSPVEPHFLSPLRYGLTIGANPLVQVFGFSGGEPVAQDLTGTVGPDGALPKRISGYQYQDIVFYYQPIPNSVVNSWLSDSLLGKASAASGQIVVQPFMSSSRSGLSFTNAFVKVIVFPEGDSTTGSPTALRITLAVQRTNRSGGDFTNVPMTHIDPFGSLRKGVFSINIDGMILNDVSRIEPLTYSTTLIPAAQGGGYQGAVPRSLSTLRIQLPEIKAFDLYRWHNDFVMKGLNGDAHERTGTIRWMSSQDPSTPILTLKLFGLGILSVVRLPSKPGHVQAEMYCQKLVPEFF